LSKIFLNKEWVRKNGYNRFMDCLHSRQRHHKNWQQQCCDNIPNNYGTIKGGWQQLRVFWVIITTTKYVMLHIYVYIQLFTHYLTSVAFTAVWSLLIPLLCTHKFQLCYPQVFAPMSIYIIYLTCIRVTKIRTWNIKDIRWV